jgi:hypothetical protein
MNMLKHAVSIAVADLVLTFTTPILATASGTSAYDLPFHDVLYAASRGDLERQVELAWRYETGDSAPKNMKLAEYWYRIAAEQGQSLAVTELSCFLARQNSWSTNSEAFNQLESASNRGDLVAATVLAKLLVVGPEEYRSESRAVMLLYNAFRIAQDGRYKYSEGPLATLIQNENGIALLDGRKLLWGWLIDPRCGRDATSWALRNGITRPY